MGRQCLALSLVTCPASGMEEESKMDHDFIEKRGEESIHTLNGLLLQIVKDYEVPKKAPLAYTESKSINLKRVISYYQMV